VPAVQATDAGSMLSNRELWRALGKAHLLVVASGGVVSTHGAYPARAWLSLLEHAQTAGLQTAAVGLGAIGVDDPKECVRIQRLLHNCAGGVSTRDECSKQALLNCGMGANRVSANGDPALALSGTAVSGEPEPGRIGIVLAESIPTRDTFGVEAHAADAPLLGATQALLNGLLSEAAVSVTLFHDDTEAGRESARVLTDGAGQKRIAGQAADCPLAEIRSRMAECSAILSFSLHGLILAAGAGVPVAGCDAEPGAAAFLAALGLSQYVLPARLLCPPGGAGVPPAAATEAVAAVRELAAHAAELRAPLTGKMAALRKKEAQNARMLNLLVPRRVVYQRLKESARDAAADAEGEPWPVRRGRAGQPKGRR
jgi:polysaccharide pyruvyl transferase WcaK-like protein